MKESGRRNGHERPTHGFSSNDELEDFLRQSENPIEALYNLFDTPEWHKQVEDVARVFVQKGASPKEFDFVFRSYPRLVVEWGHADERVAELIAEFGDSPRHLARALERTYYLQHDTIYRALRHSPIRPFMGDFTVYPHDRNFLPPQNVQIRVIRPEDADLFQIRKNYYIEKGFDEFSHDAERYLAHLKQKLLTETNPILQRVWQEVFDFYQKVYDLKFAVFHPQLFDQFGEPKRDKEGKPIKLPADHQKAAIVKAAQEGSLAVFDGTGSGKTIIGLGLAEYIHAGRVLVVSPGSVKDAWERKIGEYYRDVPQVVRLESPTVKRFLKQGPGNAQYVIVNYELLASHTGNNGNSEETINRLVQALVSQNYDLLILDEAHYINNANKRSNAILTLARTIPRRLVLTATPIRNAVPGDLTHIAHLLAPNDFPTPEALLEMGQNGVPVLSELLTQKTIRRRTEDLFELPPFSPETDGEIAYYHVKLNPTQQTIYDAIFEDTTLSSLAKIKLLRLAAIDHRLVMGKNYHIPFGTPSAQEALTKAYTTWLGIKQTRDCLFDSDFLVKYGYAHLFLGAHFAYSRGMDQFIENYASREIKKAWRGVVESSKFQELRTCIAQRLALGEKVIVFSGHFVKGIIRELVDDVTGEAIMQDLYTYLTKAFPEVKVGRIDGDVTAKATKRQISKRETVRQAWQQETGFKILLTNVQTSGLGIDLTINDGVTTGVSIFGIDLPYTYSDLWQLIARVYRPGQATPVHAGITEAITTIDEGVHVLCVRKREIAEIMLDGASPTEIERQIFNSQGRKSLLIDYLSSPKRTLNRLMSSMHGQGVVVNGAYLETVLEDGKTVGERVAELYSKYWEYTYSGHTARLVRQVLDGMHCELGITLGKIVDAGSGPLVLNRILHQESEIDAEVISVDFNRHMLDHGISAMESLGYPVNKDSVINCTMSSTGIEEQSCDAVVCSLAFHYSHSSDDRAAVLYETNRVLKPEGYYLLTLPEKYLDAQQYKLFAAALEKFGFRVETRLSGKAQATDCRDVPFNVWLIVAQKVSEPESPNISMDEFRFTFENPKISHYKVQDNPGKNGQDQERLVKHEKFVILDPDQNFKSKGSPEEIFSRAIWDEDITKKYEQHGWQRVQNKKGKTISLKK